MIKTLEERRAEREKELIKLLRAEQQTEDLLKRFPKELLLDEKSSLRVYAGHAYLELNPESLELTEIEILPNIAEEFGCKWSRYIGEGQIAYTTTIIEDLAYQDDIKTFHLYVNIYPKIPGTCRIIKKLTGKTKIEHQHVSIEVPDFDYLIDCGEENNDEKS